ncbi:hypothetical protein TIFTF001_038997 [Ficus carica]|uniref:Uncharacterized protein n=1 Tax=Ficus carica TaxID=3494 RepID=A0AA88JFC9_FICCA|nr:hypothetical protein TIFTF001_038997 [Ficus carica]
MVVVKVATAVAKKREREEGDGRMKGRGWRPCRRLSNEEEGRAGGVTEKISERVRQRRCRRASE